MLVFDRGLGGDGWAGFALLESLADDGDVWLENNHRGVMNGLLETPAGHLVSRHLVSQYPPGTAVLDAVPFSAGRALDRLLPARLLAGGAELPPAGRVPRGVFLSAALIVLARNAAALLGLAWTYLALRRLGLPERTAAAAVALTFFGGPLIFYSLVGMTHAPTFALAALLLLLLVRQRETGSLRLAFAAGAVVGSAVLVRYSAVALLIPALWATGRALRWRLPATCLAGFSLLLLPLPFWWRACFGSWLPPPYGGRWVITAASPWNVLFGPVHGLFLFHPALLCATAGLALAVLPGAWRGTAAIWFLAVAVLHGWWSESANPGGYGQRFLIDALPPLALGFAGWLRLDRWRGLRTGICLAATLAGYLLFFAAVGGLVPPPAPWPWPQRLSEYAVLLRHPPGPSETVAALRRSSFLLRGVLAAGPAR
jgi:4-amino-4-deoxy-L-arabinose transferase-like glycosyltransferase